MKIQKDMESKTSALRQGMDGKAKDAIAAMDMAGKEASNNMS